MKDKINISLFVLMVIGFICCQYIDQTKIKSLIDKNADLYVQLAHASIYSPVDCDTIHDTIKLYKAPVSEVSAKSYKHDIADKQLLKEMGVKSDRVTGQQTVVTTVSDTVSLNQASGKWEYHDKWTDFALSLQDTSLTYSFRDSIVSIIHRIPAHHFLFWHWGTKGYQVKLRNFNKHATINHAQFVLVE